MSLRPIGLGWLLAGLSVLGLLLGAALGSAGWEQLSLNDPLSWQIVWNIRVPRTLGAWLAGALLGLAGAVAQGLFRNPLTDPYLLGSASGSSLGLALALWLANVLPATGVVWRALGLTGAAFVGALAAVVLTLILSRGVQHSLRLLLAGVVVGVVLGALSSLVMLMVPSVQDTLQSYLLGSTALVSWLSCGLMLAVWLPMVVLSMSLGRVLDALALGESTAVSLGLPLAPLRAALVGVIALCTATAVAQTGLVAFVGLAAPHVVRALVPGAHARLLWLASLMGGVLLLWADLGARWLVAPLELPVGVVTAVLGGGYLLRLMHQQTRY
jgi:iron complex transport system permease protein